jgi:hypothetical protein
MQVRGELRLPRCFVLRGEHISMTVGGGSALREIHAKRGRDKAHALVLWKACVDVETCLRGDVD